MKRVLYVVLFVWFISLGPLAEAQIPASSSATITESPTPTPTVEESEPITPSGEVEIPIPKATDPPVTVAQVSPPEPEQTDSPTPTPTVTPSPTPRAVPVAAVRPPRRGIQLPPLSFFTRQQSADYYREQPLSRTETILLLILAATLFVWSMLILMPSITVVLLNRFNALLFPRVRRSARIMSYDQNL